MGNNEIAMGVYILAQILKNVASYSAIIENSVFSNLKKIKFFLAAVFFASAVFFGEYNKEKKIFISISKYRPYSKMHIMDSVCTNF